MPLPRLLVLGSLLMIPAFLSAEEPAEPAAEDPRRPAAITAQGVPAVPQELVDQLNQYQNTRAAGFHGWAPSGRGMLIRTRFGNSAQLHRVYEPGGRREQITFYEEPVSGRFLDRAADDALLLSIDRGGNENDQIYLLAPELAQPRLLSDGKSRNRLQLVRRDGRQILFTSNQRNGRDSDLWLGDPRDAESFRLIRETPGEFWFGADWSPNGRMVLLVRYVSANEAYLGLLDSETGELKELPLPGKEQPGDTVAAIDAAAFSADGKQVYVATDVRGEFCELARMNLEGGEVEWLTADIPWDVGQVTVDPASGRVAIVVNADGASSLYLFEEGKRREVPLPLGILDRLEFSPDGKQLGFTLSRPDAPPDAYSLTLADDKLTRWTFSETGGLDASKFVTPERIQFPSFDGRTIPAYCFKPAGASPQKKAPVLISIHGGPESQYRPYFSASTQYFVNEMGLAVIYPNVRGSSGYGKTYLKLDNGVLREDSVRDIGALLDWIAEQPDLDAERVAVAGGSYGGYMVLASLIHYGERLRAGVDVVGIANFITFLKNTAEYRVDLRRVEYGDERDPEVRAVLERISPTASAEKIRSALLVVHGVNDPRVPFSEAEQIAEKVRGAGRPVWTVFASNEGHGFARKDNYDYYQAVQVLFLQEHLAEE